MGFEEAKRIRGESLSNRIAGRLVGGESFGSSIGKSISEGTKARMTGLKEKINPMNIVKFMTGGSNLAAALTGRITGASKEDMKYFTGKSGSATTKNDTASKIKPLMDQQEGMFDVLEEIHKLLVDIREKRNADKPTEETIAEKQRNDERRHQALIQALLGKKVSDKDIPQNESKGLFDGIFDGLNNFRVNSGRDAAKASASSARGGNVVGGASGARGGNVAGGASAAGAAGEADKKPTKSERARDAKRDAKGRFVKADKEIIKKSATKELGKSIGKGSLKSIPILGLAIGAGFAISRLIEGDVVGAGIDLASGVGSALTAIPLTLTNAARDVYKDVYGNYPDPTDPEDQENLAEIYSVTKEVAAELLKNAAVPADSDTQYDALGNVMQGASAPEQPSPKTKSPSPSEKTPAAAPTPTPSATAATAEAQAGGQLLQQQQEAEARSSSTQQVSSSKSS